MDGKNQLLPRETFVTWGWNPFAAGGTVGALMRTRALPDAQSATLYQRLAAHFIDGCIMVALMLVFVILAATVENVSSHLAGAFRILGALAALAYRLLVDGFLQGQGVGKRRMGIRVVASSTGHPCGVGQSVIRALPIFIPFVGLADVFLLLVNKRRRLGDFLARTEVLQGSPLPPPVRKTRARAKQKG
jgi:uncharacterized RDD family membrane protein YckC